MSPSGAAWSWPFPSWPHLHYIAGVPQVCQCLVSYPLDLALILTFWYGFLACQVITGLYLTLNSVSGPHSHLNLLTYLLDSLPVRLLLCSSLSTFSSQLTFPHGAACTRLFSLCSTHNKGHRFDQFIWWQGAGIFLSLHQRLFHSLSFLIISLAVPWNPQKSTKTESWLQLYVFRP